MQKVKYLIICIIIIFQFGCGPSVTFIKYTENNFNPTTSVDVIRIKPIDRKFTELGELLVRITKDIILNNEEEAVLQLKEKAKEIGADAIIILGEETNIKL